MPRRLGGIGGSGRPRWGAGASLPALMLAVLAISMGFGILLPQLPGLVERLMGAEGTPAQVARTTGLLAALYMLSLFLCAPAWGALSDRLGRRPVLVVGLTGFALTTAASALFESMALLYVERLSSGVFAAAVTPVALAAAADRSTHGAEGSPALGRRLALVSIAGTSGFLIGPLAGVALARLQAAAWGGAGALTYPLLGTALLALVAALLVALTLPSRAPGAPGGAPAAPDGPRPRDGAVAALLGLGLLVAAAVAAFEVGLSLRGGMELDVAAWQVAAMFTLCSLAMVLAQAITFSPPVPPGATRWLLAPGFAALAAGLLAVPLAGTFPTALLAVGAVAVSAGVLGPVLTFWTASRAGRRSGAALGRQTSAASLGAALGSAGGGALHGVAWLPDAGFVLAAAAAALAVLPCLWLQRRLGPRRAKG